MLTFDMNDDEVGALIEAIVDTFDFTLPGRAGASLGEDIAAQAADSIAQRGNAGIDADGNPFAPNAPKWAAYKLERYHVDRPGELSGQMLSLASCLGKPEIAPDRVTMRHGLGLSNDEMGYTRSRTGVELRPYERDASDVDKGVWFTESGRPFYLIDEAGTEDLVKRVDDSLGDHIKAAGFAP